MDDNQVVYNTGHEESDNNSDEDIVIDDKEKNFPLEDSDDEEKGEDSGDESNDEKLEHRYVVDIFHFDIFHLELILK